MFAQPSEYPKTIELFTGMYEFKLYELCISMATFSNVRRKND